METTFGLSFNQLISKIIHVSTISHPDPSYACMRFYGYMACPNHPIFEMLHHIIPCATSTTINIFPSQLPQSKQDQMVMPSKPFGQKEQWNIHTLTMTATKNLH
jgi:hypothetical protein